MKTFIAVCIAVAVISCAKNWNDPLPTTPVSGNPCGVAYVTCLNMDGDLDGFCCDENTTCGGGKFSVGCPADSCCFIENGGIEASRGDGGVREMKIKGKKFKAR